MAYREVKVYSDGSHYIGIPHTTRPSKPRYTPPPERVEVKDDKTKETEREDIDKSTPSDTEDVPFVLDESELEEIEDIEDVFQSLGIYFSVKNKLIITATDSTVAHSPLITHKHIVIAVCFGSNLKQFDFHCENPPLRERNSVSKICRVYGYSQLVSSGKRLCLSGITTRRTVRSHSSNSCNLTGQSK